MEYNKENYKGRRKEKKKKCWRIALEDCGIYVMRKCTKCGGMYNEYWILCFWIWNRSMQLWI